MAMLNNQRVYHAISTYIAIVWSRPHQSSTSEWFLLRTWQSVRDVAAEAGARRNCLRRPRSPVAKGSFLGIHRDQ